MAALFVAVFSAAMTFVGTFDRFGVAGGLFIISALLLVIPLINNLPAILPKTVRDFLSSLAARLALSSRATKVVLVLGLVALLSGVVLWSFDIAQARLFRDEFTRTNDHIDIELYDYGESRFRSAESLDLDSQESRDREEYDKWVRWMIDDVDQDIDLEEEGVVVGTESQRMIYVEGVPFDRSYTDVDAFVTISTRLDVIDAVAFLKSDSPIDASISWYRPRLRQVRVTTSKEKRTIDILLDSPNYNERPILFAIVKPVDEKSGLPSRDEILGIRTIGVRP
jgi:hypothetical protein